MATSIISDISFKDLRHLCDKISVSSRDKKGEYLKKYINSFREYAKKKKGEDPTVVSDVYIIVLNLCLFQIITYINTSITLLYLFINFFFSLNAID